MWVLIGNNKITFSKRSLDWRRLFICLKIRPDDGFERLQV